MSLLNDALRKKRNEAEIKEDVHIDPKNSASRNDNKLKFSRIFVLLFLFGSVVFGGWYFLGSLSAEVDLHLPARSAAQNVEIIESSSISESNWNNQEELESDNETLKPMSEISPLQESAETETIKVETNRIHKDEPAARIHSAKVPPPRIKKAVSETRSLEKKPSQKPVKEKDESPPSRQEGLFLRKALRYHRQGKLDLAIQMYQQVLSVKPDHPDALFNLASAYIQLTSYSEAYPLLKKLMSRDSGNPEILVNLAIVELGFGNPAKAIDLLDMAAKQNKGPKFGIFFHRAAALSRLDRLEEARDFYEKAKELNPRHPTLFFNLAVLCDKLQKYNEAVNYYRTFLRLNDKLPDHEKKDIEGRIRSLQAYLSGK